MIEALAEHGPAVAVGPDRLGVRFDVVASSAGEAVTRGVALFQAVTGGLEPVRIEVERVDELERQLARSNAPALLGVAEVADALDVSKQRVTQLMQAGSFPAPTARLRAGPIWRRASVAAFVRRWDRRVGRRPRAASAAAVGARG
ncbi:MAG: hypothetical protein JO057_15910 [Chloroflexi bacterium]|nr:hypothetical protein [Chloroflexota bacterium]